MFKLNVARDFFLLQQAEAPETTTQVRPVEEVANPPSLRLHSVGHLKILRHLMTLIWIHVLLLRGS